MLKVSLSFFAVVQETVWPMWKMFRSEDLLRLQRTAQVNAYMASGFAWSVIMIPFNCKNKHHYTYSVEGSTELFCCSKGNSSTNLKHVSIRGSSSVTMNSAWETKFPKVHVGTVYMVATACVCSKECLILKQHLSFSLKSEKINTAFTLIDIGMSHTIIWDIFGAENFCSCQTLRK